MIVYYLKGSRRKHFNPLYMIILFEFYVLFELHFVQDLMVCVTCC